MKMLKLPWPDDQNSPVYLHVARNTTILCRKASGEAALLIVDGQLIYFRAGGQPTVAEIVAWVEAELLPRLGSE